MNKILLVLVFLMGLLSASGQVFAEVAASGFETPTDSIKLIPSEEKRTRLTFVDFQTFNHSQLYSEGILEILEHDLMYRSDLEGKYDVLSRIEFKAILKKELGKKSISPVDIQQLRKSLNADYILYMDERLSGKNWFWRVRIYNGRSGAFYEEASFEYHQFHPRWTLNAIILFLSDALKNNFTTLKSAPIPAEVFSDKSIKLFPKIKRDCLNGKCLANMSDFEWMKKNNPQFLEFLFLDPLFITNIQSEAETAFELARVDLLLDRTLDATLKIDNFLKHAKSVGKKKKCLKLNAETAIKLNQPERLKLILDQLKRYDRSNFVVLFGQAWLEKVNGNFEKAIKILVKLDKIYPQRHEILTTLLSCYNELKDTENAYKTTIKIADKKATVGDYQSANKYYLELLDKKFDVSLLNRIVVKLLSDIDKKNLSTILSKTALKNPEVEGETIWWIAKIKISDNKIDEALQILNGGLQLAPNYLKLKQLHLSLSFFEKNNLVKVQRLLEQIPASKKDKYLLALLYFKLEKYEKSRQIWQFAKWKGGYNYESLIWLAKTYEKQKKYKKALKVTAKALQKFAGREELHFIAARCNEALNKPAKASSARAKGYQLAGNKLDLERFGKHLFYKQYQQLILQHPLAGIDEKGNVQSVGKVLVLDGTPGYKIDEMSEYLDYIRPYKFIDEQRVVKEISEVLSTRYDVVNKQEVCAKFKQEMNRENPGFQTRYSKNELQELAVKLGVDSFFIVKNDKIISMKNSEIEDKVTLYFFNGISNTIYFTEATEIHPYFSVYKFNRNLIAFPLALLFLLLIIYTKVSRRGQTFECASHLYKKKKFQKAADILKKYGYEKDLLTVQAFESIKKKDYAKALETFNWSKDYENALLALEMCPDNAETDKIAADIYFQLKDYDAAESYYRKTKNLLGMANIFDIKGEKTKAIRLRGQYYFENGNPTSAIDEYKKIFDYERMGMVFFYHHKYNEAVKMFKQANNFDMVKKCHARLRTNHKNIKK